MPPSANSETTGASPLRAQLRFPDNKKLTEKFCSTQSIAALVLAVAKQVRGGCFALCVGFIAGYTIKPKGFTLGFMALPIYNPSTVLVFVYYMLLYITICTGLFNYVYNL